MSRYGCHLPVGYAVGAQLPRRLRDSSVTTRCQKRPSPTGGPFSRKGEENDPQRCHDDLAVLAHVATIDEDGKPHITCAWVGVQEGRIVIATIADQRKLRNLRRDPRVTISLQGEKVNDWGLREYLVVYGTAEVTEGGAPELLQELAHTYLGPDVVFPGMPNPPPGFVTRITVDRLAGVGPWAS